MFITENSAQSKTTDVLKAVYVVIQSSEFAREIKFATFPTQKSISVKFPFLGDTFYSQIFVPSPDANNIGVYLLIRGKVRRQNMKFLRMTLVFQTTPFKKDDKTAKQQVISWTL